MGAFLRALLKIGSGPPIVFLMVAPLKSKFLNLAFFGYPYLYRTQCPAFFALIRFGAIFHFHIGRDVFVNVLTALHSTHAHKQIRGADFLSFIHIQHI